jgi:hypothetical protein
MPSRPSRWSTRSAGVVVLLTLAEGGGQEGDEFSTVLASVDEEIMCSDVSELQCRGKGLDRKDFIASCCWILANASDGDTRKAIKTSHETPELRRL